MAKATSSTPLTPDQQEAARTAKAAQERTRRTVAKALDKAGIALGPGEKLTAEQKARAAESAEKKPGLSAKALASWIMDGQGVKEQVEGAQAANAEAEKTERTRANVTRSADPDAAALAAAAKALAPDVKSAFLPKDAREFIDVFKVVAEGQSLTVSRTGAQGVEGALEEVTIKRADLKKFAVEGEKDGDVRGILSKLGKGTRLWGRKLGLMILATDAKK